jgi:hypothetical protein
MSGPDFASSEEAAFRRLVRDAVRKGPFTKGERDVVMALVNHWFHHRNSAKNVIHPGRTKLAKRADVTIKTVSRCLDMLRDQKVITAVGYLEGLHGKATEYTLSSVHLLALCKRKKADISQSGETNVPTRGWDKMSRRSCDVISFPSQGKRGASNA